MRITGERDAQLSRVKTNLTGKVVLVAAATCGGNQSNLRQASASFGRVNALVNALDPLLRPGDEGNVVRLTNFFAHVAHQAQVGIRIHTELTTYLPVGVS